MRFAIDSLMKERINIKKESLSIFRLFSFVSIQWQKHQRGCIWLTHARRISTRTHIWGHVLSSLICAFSLKERYEERCRGREIRRKSQLVLLICLMRFAICATIKNPFNSFLFHCLLPYLKKVQFFPCLKRVRRECSCLLTCLKRAQFLPYLKRAQFLPYLKRVQLLTSLLEESSVSFFKHFLYILNNKRASNRTLFELFSSKELNKQESKQGKNWALFKQVSKQARKALSKEGTKQGRH